MTTEATEATEATDPVTAAAPGAHATPASDAGDEPMLLHHDYDGIHEYDNPLPFWWSSIFVLSIIFAGWYLYWYHGGGPGKSELQEYAIDLKAWEKVRAAAPVQEIPVDEEILTAMGRDTSAIAAGRAVFVKNCVSCHLDNGSGQIGPNLTDGYQIHGSKRMDIYQTIYDGVPDKGMLTWSTVLNPEDLLAVAAYVTTLRGQNLPGKPSEGAPVEPFR
jgi:cytochrome c oxidase cbb3-type subunit III